MEPVGFCGIIKLTTQIIHRNLKHFLCIAIVLALPYALLLAFIPSSADALLRSLALLYEYASHGQVPSNPPHPLPYPLPLLIAVFVFTIVFSLFTQPLLTFSVCRAVLNKSLAFKSSLLAVPRSALNLILTVLCATGLLLGLYVAIVILMVGLWAIGIDLTIVAVIGGVVVAGVVLYLAIAWSLAYTVVILEEKRGWEAMKRSMYLVEGSKWVVLSLAVVYEVCMMFLPISASEGASVMWRWSCVLLSVGLQAIVALWSMASTVVLYLSCKSRCREPLDTLVALSAEFGPLETSAKYLDLESAGFDTP